MLQKINAVLQGSAVVDGDGDHKGSWVEIRSLAMMCLALGATYGVFMGLYSMTRADNPMPLQLPSSVVKVPLLFLVTLIITVPSLYVFATLAGARLQGRQLLRLMIGSVAMTLAVLASLGPITGFFTLSTDSHSFMVILNGIFFAISGGIGVSFLYKSLCQLFRPESSVETKDETIEAQDSGAASPPVSTDTTQGSIDDVTKDEPGLLRMADRHHLSSATPGPVVRSQQPFRREIIPPSDSVRRGFVLRMWVVMYAIVGAQMSWIMRPLIGDPDEPFAIFSPTESNFFTALSDILFG
ncbi:MAG: hypothetical protein ACI97A_002374 [Planctomycetota bacterium]|jgi:hypothetical protein